MNPYLRNTLVIIAAIIVGMIVNGGIVSISASIIPPPDGVDPNDMDSLKENIQLYRPKHFLMPFLAHAIGTLAGAYFAARLVTKAPAFFGFAIGVFFLLGGISMAWILPAPFWFEAVDIIFAYLPFAMVGNVLAKRKRSD
jgi:hypothetical protein